MNSSRPSWPSRQYWRWLRTEAISYLKIFNSFPSKISRKNTSSLLRTMECCLFLIIKTRTRNCWFILWEFWLRFPHKILPSSTRSLETTRSIMESSLPTRGSIPVLRNYSRILILMRNIILSTFTLKTWW